MGQLVGTALTVVGYAVGGMFGVPMLGAAVGAAVGYMLQPDLPTQRGPRMEDRRVQVSSYGAPIPLAYGTVRLAGNVIWARDIEEHEDEHETSAKGGGPSQTTIIYTYFGTFAVLLGFGPCRGVRRIWADAVLIYDGSVDAPTGDECSFVFYGGTEDQLPDPTMEAVLGSGNVPAYRGFAYIVFHRLPLERFGNRIPSISVEMVARGEWSSVANNIGTASTQGPYAHAIQRTDGKIVAASELDDTLVLSVIDPATGLVEKTHHHTNIPFFSPYAANDYSSMSYFPPINEIRLNTGISESGLHRFDAVTLVNTGTLPTGEVWGWDQTISAYEVAKGQTALHRSSTEINPLTLMTLSLDAVLLEFNPADGIGTLDPVEGLFFGRQIVSGAETFFLVVGGFAIGVCATDMPTGLLHEYPVSGTGTLGVWDAERRRYAVFGEQDTGGAVWLINESDYALIEMVTPAGMFGHSSPQDVQYLRALDVYVVWSSVAGVVICTVLDAETLEVLHQNMNTATNGLTRVFPSPDDPGAVFVLGTYQPYTVQLYGTTVGATVASLCQASGLVPGDYNVAELGQRLRGYLVSQVGPARSAVEQLAQAFLFEGTEEDDVLYFRRRGGATVATLTAADCGAGIDEAAPFGIQKARAQEADLPAKLYITAPDPYTDHQAGTQYGERQASQAGDDEQLQFAVVLSADESRRLADALLFDRWASRGRRMWATSRKFARLVPTDPITLDGERVRILSRSDEGAVIRWEGVTDDADVVVQTITGVRGVFPRQRVALSPPTSWIMLDIALLRDADDEPGAYVAAYGMPPSWRGGLLYHSPYNFGWERVLTMPAPGSAIGAASNALGNWTGGNVFDETNRLNVSLGNGTMESTTRLSVLNGANVLALEGPDGWEVLQYRDAVLEDDGTYTLSGLLRGRRGTEYAMAGHAVGNRVVLLSTSSIRTLSIDSSAIDVPRLYRFVSVGNTIANTPEREETITAERLRPWSPVQLGGGRTAAGDVLLQWRRRTRVGGEWRDSVDASLGEASEAYEVDIYTDATRDTVARTLSGLSTPSATYTAAEQTADFGAPQATVYWAAYQLSATVGRGHAAHGTT